MRSIVLICHDIRSTHNVGSLLRTAEGLGVTKVYLSGYTPYPRAANDTRLPHLSAKLDGQIHKTALGAEASIPWEHAEDIHLLLRQLHTDNFRLVALEQTSSSVPLPSFNPDQHRNIALLLGREVEGIDPALLALVDDVVEIPMFGRKESFNVVQAAAMALYHFRFR